MTELSVVGDGKICARAFRGDADRWNGCTHQPPLCSEIDEIRLIQHTVVNNMKCSLEFLLHYFVQLLLCRSDFISQNVSGCLVNNVVLVAASKGPSVEKVYYLRLVTNLSLRDIIWVNLI